MFFIVCSTGPVTILSMKMFCWQSAGRITGTRCLWCKNLSDIDNDTWGPFYHDDVIKWKHFPRYKEFKEFKDFIAVQNWHFHKYNTSIDIIQTIIKQCKRAWNCIDTTMYFFMCRNHCLAWVKAIAALQMRLKPCGFICPNFCNTKHILYFWGVQNVQKWNGKPEFQIKHNTQNWMISCWQQ